jgi:chromosome segregation ATPase
MTDEERQRLKAEIERLAQSVAQSITELTLTNERLKSLLGELRDEIERLRQERDELITDGVAADAEIERLRTQCGGNCRYWEGRYRDEAAEVERLQSYVDTSMNLGELLKSEIVRLRQTVNDQAAEIERLKPCW